MASYLGRRKFLATLGGAVTAWPLAARAQQPTMQLIGFLSGGCQARPPMLWQHSVRDSTRADTSKVKMWRSEYRWVERRAGLCGPDERL